MAQKISERNIEQVYQPTDFVEKEYVDIVQFYALRIILDLGGHKEFIDSNNYIRHDNLGHFLNLSKFIDLDRDEFQKKELIELLSSKYDELKRKSPNIKQTTLYKNIEKLREYIPIGKVEMEFVTFFVLVKQFEILEEATNLFGNNLNTKQALRLSAKILKIPQAKLEKVINESVLFQSGFLSFEEYKTDLANKVDFLNNTIPEKFYNSTDNIFELLKDTFCEMNPHTLKINDFTHIKKDLSILITYLKHAIESKQWGVNILLYGKPGTGKTELSKIISKKLKRKLYEVSYISTDTASSNRLSEKWNKRLIAYKTAQIFLKNNNAVLLYDEAEDIFESYRGGLWVPPSRQKDKAWINKILESNSVPTIWITNYIQSIDPAIVRRFDYTLELPIPPLSKRKKILKKYTKKILKKKTLQLLAKEENIAPALVSRAAKVVTTLSTENKDEEFIHIINNTLRAQGYREIKTKILSTLPSFYTPSFINSSTNLEQLAEGIKKNPDARLCLYGPPGTGKSAFGRYVAQIVQKPVILKKGSDLINMWVGQTEKNIANAFKEAKDADAVLIFDEVDSFLQDRSRATASWQVTQVNEMLLQMENFDGIFIATTNLMEGLDKASIRRFDLKLEFGYLQPQQAYNLFCAYAKEMQLTGYKKHKNSILSLRKLTPGDFKAVERQTKFHPIDSAKDFIDRLQVEIALKDESIEKTAGFLKP